MSVDDFFERLIAALERAEVPYMVTGSYASSAHGTPRATNDIDIVIAKLEWYKLGESERQIEDAAGVIRRQGAALDRSYVERWVRELGLENEWRKALAAAN